MTQRTYNWKRYWIPRDGRLNFDSQGFLVPPAADADWAKHWPAGTVGFEELLKCPCLVLLGEPGIGKSTAIRQAAERTREIRGNNGVTILTRQLGAYTTDAFFVKDVFGCDEYISWQKHGGELHVFLDSFDECLLRIDSVAELLAEQIGRASSIKNLFLRIASRTAEWRTCLEEALEQRWGRQYVGVYELAPLTREQVVEAATAQAINATQFINDAIANDVVSFAIKPLTLELLIRVWQDSGGSLPPTQRDLYHRGCGVLCSDSEKRQSPNLHRHLSAEQRLAIAAHIAAATFFCNRASIWTGPNPARKPAGDLSLAELATGSVTVKGQRLSVNEASLREALDTGLFTSRGPNRLGWAHQTYGEYLAARYIEQECLTERQALDLLTHPHDPDHKLIPQLQEVAAWAAIPGSRLFEHLAKVQPEVLLRSDVATADAPQKAALVDALMVAFGRGSVCDQKRGLRLRYCKLTHSGLSHQLRDYLLNRQQSSEPRIEAISMIQACKLDDLISLLADLALNTEETSIVRQWAAATVACSTDKNSRMRLRPLALGKTGVDPQGELQGAGLTACWPDYLTAAELFSSLTGPDEGFGLYNAFLQDRLTPKLTASDLPAALSWVEVQPPGNPFVGCYGRLMSDILDCAADHLEADYVLTSIAKTLTSRLRKHDFGSCEDASHLIEVLKNSPDLRLRLVDRMVEVLQDANEDSLPISLPGVRLVTLDDLDWLIVRLHSASSPELQKRFALLIASVFYPRNCSQANAVLEAANACPLLADVMPQWLKPMDKDSEEARKTREWHFLEERLRFKLEKATEPTLLSPPPAERLIALLDVFEAGDLDAWWQLCRLMEVKSDGRLCEKHFHMDIRDLEGWQKATPTTKIRLIHAAERYLTCRRSNPAVWFKKKNVRFHPDVAGFRALLLLAKENPSAYEGLPSDVWRRWIPAILRLPHWDELEDHQLLATKALERAPEEAIDWSIKIINVENAEGGNLWILQKLPKHWSDALGTALLKRLRNGRLKSNCFVQLLEALLLHDVKDALEFTRAKIPRKVPTSDSGRDLAVQTARMLMWFGKRGDWPRVWNLVCTDTDFGKSLLERFELVAGPPPVGVMKVLTEAEIGKLWEWMLTQYPTAQDPDRSRGGEVSTRHAMANLRDSLISHLADLGTTAGCVELKRLTASYPQFAWLRRVLLRGEEQVRRLTWIPTSPELVFQLKINNQARLVSSGAQLLEVIVESLEKLQSELQGETPLARLLWNIAESKRSGPKLASPKPKPEEDISDWVKVQLEKLLTQRGIVLGREVQFHQLERADLLVTAVTKEKRTDTYSKVKVIIEVKGDWNAKLKTAMETQLVDRYLNDNDCRHGLYLVGYFSSLKRESFDGLRAHLSGQAQSLTNRDRTIKALVLDCTIDSPAAAITKARGRPRR